MRGWRAAPAVVLLWAMCARGAVQPHAWPWSAPAPRGMHRRFPVLRGGCGVPAPACLPECRVQRLRGGSAHGAAGEGAGGEDALLAIDLGAQNTRAAMGTLPGRVVPGLSSEGLATLVQVACTCCMHVRICIRVHARACVHAYAPACLARICIAAALAAPRPHTLPPTCPRRARRHAPVSQNDMSKLDTPTAVAFRGSKCEVGELAVRAHTWVLCHSAVCARAHSVAVFLVGALSPARALYVSHRD